MSKTGAVRTINVVEYSEGAIQQLLAYEDTDMGKTKAEEMFVHLATGNGMDKADTEDCLDDGIFEQGDYQVFLLHSTNYSALQF
jgi:hypothetical protein